MFVALLWTCSNRSVFPVLRAPDLDAGLEVGSPQSRAEGQNHLSRPVGDAAFDAVQDMLFLLGCERTLPAHEPSQPEEVKAPVRPYRSLSVPKVGLQESWRGTSLL